MGLKSTYIDKLKLKNEFTRNVLTLMMGTTIAQAIPIAISPILTRIYTPKDFGVFAVFFALTGIFGSIANGRYELAIMLPKDDEDAINLVAVGLLVSVVISLLIFLIILLFKQSLLDLVKGQDIGIWLYFVPISVFFVGIFNILTYFNSRRKNYHDIKNSTIIKSIILSIIQIIVGLVKPGASGLVFGEVISRIIANRQLTRNITDDKQLIKSVSVVSMKQIAKKYIDFPLFSVWAILFNNLAVKGIDLTISTFYSIGTLGFYSLADRILGVPTSLIGKSFGQVYFQEASDEYKNTNSLKKTFLSTLKKSLIIGVIIFVPLFFAVEDIFTFIFGEEWRISGVFAKYLTFLYFCRFIVAPFTLTPIVVHKVKIDLFFQMFLFGCSSIILYVNYKFLYSIDIYLIILSLFLGFYYFSYLFFLYLKVINK